MQIQGYTLFMGNRTKDKKTSVWNNNTQQTQSDKTEHKKTIFVGNGQTNQTDTLAQKKKEAQDKAMKVIRDAFQRMNTKKCVQIMRSRRQNFTVRSRMPSLP